MGEYATTTSISELLPQFLSGNTTTSDAAGTAIFSRHVDRAEGIVKSFVGSRYDLDGLIIGTTTTNVPVLMRTLSEDIACYFAMRGSYVQDGNQKQAYLDEYKLAMEILAEIRDGKTKLVDTSGTELPPRSSSRFYSSTDGYTHIFNLDDPQQWEVSNAQTSDMADARDD